MPGRTNRLGIRLDRQGKAHFLAGVAKAVACCAGKWREEAPEQWPQEQRAIDPEELQRSLHEADHMGLDPCLLAYVVMGAEWLFRARQVTQLDVERALDELEQRLQRISLADSRPWQASLIVGGIYPAVLRGLARTRYLISLGQWAFPIRGWRELVAGDERGRKCKTMGRAGPSVKPGKMPALSPIVAGLIVDSLGAEVSEPRTGSRALALEVASILRGRKVQSGEFGVWSRAAEGPAPADTGPAETSEDPAATPLPLRDYLAARWKRAYRARFEQLGRIDHCKRYWSTFMVEVSHNPLSVFASLADVQVVTELYAIPWYHDLSPRRRTAPARPKRAARPKESRPRRH